MGTGHTAKKAGSRSKVKKYKRKIWLCRRDKDVDQIQDELEKKKDEGRSLTEMAAFDDELPGGGQFYCAETAKHFIDATALENHKKTKFFKRRLKALKEEKYTQEISDWAGGMAKEKLPPVHPRTT
jgi:bud site selection protein 20